MAWTRITDPDIALAQLPAWFAGRMMASRGTYGFLMSTGDVVRVTRVTALHLAASGTLLIDVLLDHAGVPLGVDTAWHSKHYLGAPVVAATLATLNAAHIVMAVEFQAAELAEAANDSDLSPGFSVLPLEPPTVTAEPVAQEAD